MPSMGTTLTPGLFISSRKKVRPLLLFSSGLVLASVKHQSELAVKGVKKQFVDEAKKSGIDIPEEIIEEEIDRMARESKQLGM